MKGYGRKREEKNQHFQNTKKEKKMHFMASIQIIYTMEFSFFSFQGNMIDLKTLIYLH